MISPLFQQFQPAANEWRRRLKRAFNWWLDELHALLPSRLALASKGECVVSVREQEQLFLKVKSGNWQRLSPGQEKSVRGVALLALPDEMVLEKCWQLPRAAEENLCEVIAFEMHRHTPFVAEQVLFQHRVLERTETQLRVRVTLVPKTEVDRRLAVLASRGLMPRALVFGNGGGERRFPLAGPSTRARRRTAMLATAATTFAAIAVLLPVMEHRDRVTALEQQVAAARFQAGQARQLEAAWQSRVERHRELLERRTRQWPVVTILRELTELLPDDTWLLRLEIARGELRLEGESSGASHLIALLENAHSLRDARFASPVTFDRQSGRERFTVVTQLAQTPLHSATADGDER